MDKVPHNAIALARCPVRKTLPGDFLHVLIEATLSETNHKLFHERLAVIGLLSRYALLIRSDFREVFRWMSDRFYSQKIEISPALRILEVTHNSSLPHVSF
jgi:hypothetical protein